jgi:zinc transporter ZupT
MHNMPEGLAVASGFMVDLSLGALVAFLIGAVAAALLLLQDVGHMTLAFSSALAAGAMVYITIDELIPEIYVHGEGHAAILGITSGVIAALALMSLS